MLSSDLVKLRRIVDKITKGFVESEDGSFQPIQTPKVIAKAEPKALVETHIDEVCYRVGTKPLTNLVVVQHEDNNNLLDESDFFGKTAVIASSYAGNPIAGLITAAANIDQYEYFLYLPKSAQLSMCFYSNLSNWRPLVRYQVMVGSPTECLDVSAVKTEGHDYVLSDHVVSDGTVPIIINQRAASGIRASGSIDTYVKNNNLKYFYANQNILFGNIQLEWSQELGPLVYPDGVSAYKDRRRYERVFSICRSFNSVSYYGKSTADIITLAQACRVVNVFAPQGYVDRLDLVIWLDRFGLRNRVRFYSCVSSGLPTSEVVFFSEWSEDVNLDLVPLHTTVIVSDSLKALAVTASLKMKNVSNSGNIQVFLNEAR
jgi:hypothetical protein